MRHLHGDAFEIYSAGLETHGLNPRAVRVMAEAGVDIGGHQSQRVADLPVAEFEFVVTVCDHAHQECPYFPAKTRVLHQGFDDPPGLARDAVTEEDALGHYRRVCEEIRRYVQTLPALLDS